LALVALALAACGPDYKKLSEDALGKADRFVAAAQTNGGKINPTEIQKLSDSLKVAKGYAADGKFKEAYNSAVDVANASIMVSRGFGPKKTELENSYESVAKAIAPAARTTMTKIKQLQAGRKVPAGMTAASFDSLAKASQSWEATWKEAVAFHEQGEIAQAAAKAEKVRDDVLGAMKALGIKQ
jgi:hypothetical protein